jgi:hypothetical protein
VILGASAPLGDKIHILKMIFSLLEAVEAVAEKSAEQIDKSNMRYLHTIW